MFFFLGGGGRSENYIIKGPPPIECTRLICVWQINFSIYFYIRKPSVPPIKFHLACTKSKRPRQNCDLGAAVWTTYTKFCSLTLSFAESPVSSLLVTVLAAVLPNGLVLHFYAAAPMPLLLAKLQKKGASFNDWLKTINSNGKMQQIKQYLMIIHAMPGKFDWVNMDGTKSTRKPNYQNIRCTKHRTAVARSNRDRRLTTISQYWRWNRIAQNKKQTNKWIWIDNNGLSAPAAPHSEWCSSNVGWLPTDGVGCTAIDFGRTIQTTFSIRMHIWAGTFATGWNINT